MSLFLCVCVCVWKNGDNPADISEPRDPGVINDEQAQWDTLKQQNGTEESFGGSEEKQREFLSRLEEAITDSSTKSMWKKYANKFTMRFKDTNLEAKVNGHRDDSRVI